MTIWDYCKEHKNAIVFEGLLAAIFFITFALYHLPLEAVGYPIVLSLVVGGIFLVIDYRRYKKRYDHISLLRNSPLEEEYDFSGSVLKIEEAYQELVMLFQGNLADHSMISNEKYNQMMDYYTMWVHQIKTPIASMRITLENMDSPEARKLTADLLRIEQYVNMVLTYLRLQSESSDYVLKDYEIDELVKPAIRRFSSEFIGRRLSLSYEPIRERVVTDEKWFGFVLEQVLSNALKYTKEGGIRIYMEDTNLVVEDTGIGIAPEDVPRIFEKGFTGFNGRLDQKASGIGLFLCKKICDRLKLPIRAESKTSEGTRILIGVKQSQVDIRD